MTSADTRQARNRDSGIPGHPTKFAPRTHGHAKNDAVLSGLSAGFGTDSLKPWDEQSDTYSLVETQRVINADGTEREILLDVARSDNPVVQRLAAQADIRDEDAAHDVFEVLSQSSDPEVLRLLGGNRRVPAELLRSLTQQARESGDEYVASAVSENPSADAATMEELHTHPSFIVRAGVAANPSTSEAILKGYLDDSSPLVQSVASNSIVASMRAKEYRDRQRDADSTAKENGEIAGFIPTDNPPF
jgi:hypothetical protein